MIPIPNAFRKVRENGGVLSGQFVPAEAWDTRY
jgi:hypothetical protein